MLRGKVAGLWIPTDNVIASGSAILAKSAADAGLPVVTGDLVFVQGGCLATVTISHHTLGRMTAERAVAILEGKQKPGDIPVARQETSRIVMNRTALAALRHRSARGSHDRLDRVRSFRLVAEGMEKPACVSVGARAGLVLKEREGKTCGLSGRTSFPSPRPRRAQGREEAPRRRRVRSTAPST